MAEPEILPPLHPTEPLKPGHAVKKKQVGGKKQALASSTAGAGGETAPAAPKPHNPHLYFSYYYETKEGDTGFEHTVLSNVYSVRTQGDLATIIGVIMKQAPTPDHFTKITPISWYPLEA